MRLRRESRQSARITVFFASDIHGSERCFRKWLNAAAAYNADALILGGDITGKGLSPIVESHSGGQTGSLNGQTIAVSSSQALAELRAQIEITGLYDIVVSEDEDAQLRNDPDLREERIRAETAARLERWVALADERLARRSLFACWMLGNDDDGSLAEIMRSSRSLVYAEDSLLELPGGFELLSVGFSNPTPFGTPRELPEVELAAEIQGKARQLARPEHAVFNLHCPPYDTLLDAAPRLDEDLRPVAQAGGVETAPAGSRAVRDAVEEYQPLLGLHGHIHESAAVQKLGRTLCVNPGSEYVDGIVRGALLSLHPDKGLLSWQLLQG